MPVNVVPAVLHVAKDGVEVATYNLFYDTSFPPGALTTETGNPFSLEIEPGGQRTFWVEITPGGEVDGALHGGPINQTGLYAQSSKLMEVDGKPTGWHVESTPKEGWPDHGRYAYSLGFEVKSKTPDQGGGEERRVLDNKLLSGFLDAGNGMVPYVQNGRLIWKKPSEGGASGGKFIGPVDQPDKVGREQTGIYSTGVVGLPLYLIHRDIDGTFWVQNLSEWNGETWPPPSSGGTVDESRLVPVHGTFAPGMVLALQDDGTPAWFFPPPPAVSLSGSHDPTDPEFLPGGFTSYSGTADLVATYELRMVANETVRASRQVVNYINIRDAGRFLETAQVFQINLVRDGVSYPVGFKTRYDGGIGNYAIDLLKDSAPVGVTLAPGDELVIAFYYQITLRDFQNKGQVSTQDWLTYWRSETIQPWTLGAIEVGTGSYIRSVSGVLAPDAMRVVREPTANLPRTGFEIVDPKDAAEAPTMRYRRLDGETVSLSGAGGGSQIEIVQAVVEKLRAPQIVDGLKYATSELNYDSQRDGWNLESVGIDVDERHTNTYEVGIPGVIYRGNGETGVRGGAVGGAEFTAAAVGEVWSSHFTVTQTGATAQGLFVSGSRFSFAQNGASITFRVSLVKDGVTLFTQDVTRTSKATPLYAFDQPLALTPGDYELQYSILSTAGDQGQLLYVTTYDTASRDPRAFIPAPFANENWALFKDGAQQNGVGNAHISLYASWENQTLAVPVTLSASGSDMLASGSGYVQLGTVGAPMSQTQRHRAVVEFTLAPLDPATGHFSTLLTPKQNRLQGAPYFPNSITTRYSLHMWRGMWGGNAPEAADAHPTSATIYYDNGPEVAAKLAISDTPLRLRYELDIYWGVTTTTTSKGWVGKYALFNGDTGETLAASPVTPSEFLFLNGPGDITAFAPAMVFNLTPGYQEDGQHIPSWNVGDEATNTTLGRVPEGVQKLSRVLIHRWVEWREQV